MKLFQKITTLLLVALIFVGTTGFTVEEFYCGSHLKSVHIFTSPKPCCSQPNTPGGACRTETEYIKADINSDIPVLAQKIEQPTLSPAILTAFVQLLVSNGESYPVKYLNYKPPLLLKDIPVLTLSLLI
ncbi:MAG TPA: hypothetical protein ENH85_13560 [Candidatus Scalindua sp.]|nr:hypothetical protein [Candidatus Scalindua sp.]